MFICVYGAKLEDPKNISILEDWGKWGRWSPHLEPATWLSEVAQLLRSWALRIL